jgi:hypothetical protein
METILYGMRRNLAPGDIRFDPDLDISPFALFRALKEGREPLLIDVRPAPGRLSFAGALAAEPGPAWTPPEGSEAVLFDDDGTLAAGMARRLRAAGFSRVRSLFGGLELYDFSLDPAVVGDERFLKRPST